MSADRPASGRFWDWGPGEPTQAQRAWHYGMDLAGALVAGTLRMIWAPIAHLLAYLLFGLSWLVLSVGSLAVTAWLIWWIWQHFAAWWTA